MSSSNEDDISRELPGAILSPDGPGQGKQDLFNDNKLNNYFKPSKSLMNDTKGMDGLVDTGSRPQGEYETHSAYSEKTNPGISTIFFGEKNDRNLVKMECDPNSNEPMEDTDPLTELILNHSRDELEHLTVAFHSIGDKAKFFQDNRRFFFCGQCWAPIKGDGFANGTYRLKCKPCKTSVSLAIALSEVVEMINYFHPGAEMELVAPAADEDTPKPARKRANRKREDPSSSDDDRMNHNEAVLAEGSFLESGFLKELKSMMVLLNKENKAFREEIAHIRKENAELRKMVLDLSRTAQVPIQNGPAARAPSFAETVARNLPSLPTATTKPKGIRAGSPKGAVPPEAKDDGAKHVNAATSPSEPTGKRLPRIYRKDLTNEEYQKLFNGQPIRPPKRIVTLYVNKGNGQTKRISELRHILKVYAGMEMRNVLHIDYVGKSVVEFHLYDCYLESFKVIATEKFPQWEILEGLDPLNDSLLRRSILEDKAVAAAEKYKNRLTKRLKTTPSAAHRRFLESELARANKSLEDRMSSDMQVESSNLTCLPVSPPLC